MTAPAGLDPKLAYIASQWPYDRPLHACRFDPTGKFVFCGGEDANVERFNLADGAKTVLTGGHETWVQAFGFSKDGAQAFSGGCDGKLYMVGDRGRGAEADSVDRGPQGLDSVDRREP